MCYRTSRRCCSAVPTDRSHFLISCPSMMQQQPAQGHEGEASLPTRITLKSSLHLARVCSTDNLIYHDPLFPNRAKQRVPTSATLLLITLAVISVHKAAASRSGGLEMPHTCTCPLWEPIAGALLHTTAWHSLPAAPCPVRAARTVTRLLSPHPGASPHAPYPCDLPSTSRSQ